MFEAQTGVDPINRKADTELQNATYTEFMNRLSNGHDISVKEVDNAFLNFNLSSVQYRELCAHPIVSATRAARLNVMQAQLSMGVDTI